MALAPRIAAGVAAVAVPLICAFEGLRVNAYLDPIGIPTVCFGHIEGVKLGHKYTKKECEEMLHDDLPKYEADVLRCIRVPMHDSRHAAILSFTYNVGGAALCKSSVARHLNAGRVREGCDALLLYKMAGGRVLPGLERRRKEERRLCLLPGPLPTEVVAPSSRPRPEIVQEPPKPSSPPVAIEPLRRKTFLERAWNWVKRYWRYRWFGN
jgi:lysozyme